MSAIRDCTVSTRLRESQAKQLREAAACDDCTTSELVARLIRLELIRRAA